jgi:hypothetical protein
MSANNDRWGCPDWLEEESYRDDLKDWQWRWEFLKRTKQYRRAWERGIPTDGSHDRLHHPEDLEYSIAVFGLPNLPHPGSDFRGSHNIFNPRGGHVLTRITSPADVFDAIERLAIPPDQQIQFVRSQLRYLQSISDLMSEREMRLCIIDLTAPIKPQLQKLDQILKESQKHHLRKLIHFKKRRKNWPRHLRIIDAKDQGAAHAKVFLQFVDDGWATETAESQPNAQVSQWIKQAQEVMEKAARFL